jgi:hypothetical protein
MLTVKDSEELFTGTKQRILFVPGAPLPVKPVTITYSPGARLKKVEVACSEPGDTYVKGTFRDWKDVLVPAGAEVKVASPLKTAAAGIGV